MKYKLIVDGKNGHEEGIFDTEAEAIAHFEDLQAKEHWGKNAHEIFHPEVQAVEAKEAVVDPDTGEVISQAVEAVEAVPAWTENVPDAYAWSIVPFSPTPSPISRKQLKLALLDINVTEETIDAAINQLPSPAKEEAMIQWKDSSDFKFDHPLVAPLASVLGFNDEQIRAVWLNGASKE